MRKGDINMFIEAERWHFDGSCSFKIVEFKKCCDDMIKSPNTCLNHDYEYTEEDDDYSVKLILTVNDYEMGDVNYFEKINYCPFCGKEINIDIIREVDKNEEYKTLTEERNSISEKCRKTDSIKKHQELANKLQILDKEINNMWQNDDFQNKM